MKTNRITPIIWAYAALALMASMASTGASANTLTMDEYNGPSNQITCEPECQGFIGDYPGGPISLSLTMAENYPTAGNPDAELARLNELLGLFEPARDPVPDGDVDKTDSSGTTFDTSYQYFSVKKAEWLWFFENTSGGEVTVTVLGDSYSHWTGYGDPVSPIPVPAAVWLFGTALIGFIGISRRTKIS